jgi:putative membrane protein
MFIGMLLFWGLLIAGAYWLVRLLFDNKPRQFVGPKNSPREILEQRYARGEIGKAEYDQILSDLSR